MESMSGRGADTDERRTWRPGRQLGLLGVSDDSALNGRSHRLPNGLFDEWRPSQTRLANAVDDKVQNGPDSGPGGCGRIARGVSGRSLAFRVMYCSGITTRRTQQSWPRTRGSGISLEFDSPHAGALVGGSWLALVPTAAQYPWEVLGTAAGPREGYLVEEEYVGGLGPERHERFAA